MGCAWAIQANPCQTLEPSVNYAALVSWAVISCIRCSDLDQLLCCKYCILSRSDNPVIWQSNGSGLRAVRQDSLQRKTSSKLIWHDEVTSLSDLLCWLNQAFCAGGTSNQDGVVGAVSGAAQAAKQLVEAAVEPVKAAAAAIGITGDPRIPAVLPPSISKPPQPALPNIARVSPFAQG